MCKILIADDEYLEREVMKRIVSKIEGAQIVAEVNNGIKAVEMYKALYPDLVFLNYKMGGLNGL